MDNARAKKLWSFKQVSPLRESRSFINVSCQFLSQESLPGVNEVKIKRLLTGKLPCCNYNLGMVWVSKGVDGLAFVSHCALFDAPDIVANASLQLKMNVPNRLL